MTFNEYQAKALETAEYPEVSTGDNKINWVYPALGLQGEAGEVAEKLKKIIRDNIGVISSEKREEIKKELGDVAWYLAVLSHELGLKLNDVVEANYAKLSSRKQRGKIKGSGDNR